MTDKLIATDGTSSGLSAGAAISDTDYIELQQSVVSPASTVNSQFSAIKTWVKSWIAKADVGLGNVSNVDPLPSLPYYADATIYNTTPGLGTVGTGSALTANRLYMVPVYLKGGRNYTTLAMVVTAVGAGGTVAQLALFASDPTTNRPTGTLVATGGAAVTEDATGVKTAAINYTPSNSGWFYIAFVGSGAPQVASIATSAAGAILGVQFTATPSALLTYGLFRALTYSATPFVDESATTFSLPSGSTIPILGIR